MNQSVSMMKKRNTETMTKQKKHITIAITAASYSGNKGAAAMLQSSIRQLHEHYRDRLQINLMSVYPGEDAKQVPWDFVKIVSAKPEQVLFVAFPLAVLYKLFSWCPPIRALLLKNRILKAYTETDLVLDEAGISFVDSRGFVMNTYAFVTMAVPMLMGVPVAKYSQAMGPFHKFWNRFLAKWILPKMKLIIARGKITEENLRSIGITAHVKLCADGAFTMADDPQVDAEVEALRKSDAFYGTDRLCTLSLSAVVEKKCAKLGIDYAAEMTRFIDALNERGWNVLIIANAARINSEKTRNNDLMVCDRIYAAVADKEKVRWYHEEMSAEKIRALIGASTCLVASRFHSMIGSLEKKVPTLLIGWSHKYKEVLDMFSLGEYAIDFSDLNADKLILQFEEFSGKLDEIRGAIDQHYDEVMASSRENIKYVCEAADKACRS